MDNVVDVPLTQIMLDESLLASLQAVQVSSKCYSQSMVSVTGKLVTLLAKCYNPVPNLRLGRGLRQVEVDWLLLEPSREPFGSLW